MCSYRGGHRRQLLVGRRRLLLAGKLEAQPAAAAAREPRQRHGRPRRKSCRRCRRRNILVGATQSNRCPCRPIQIWVPRALRRRRAARGRRRRLQLRLLQRLLQWRFKLLRLLRLRARLLRRNHLRRGFAAFRRRRCNVLLLGCFDHLLNARDLLRCCWDAYRKPAPAPTAKSSRSCCSRSLPRRGRCFGLRFRMNSRDHCWNSLQGSLYVPALWRRPPRAGCFGTQQRLRGRGRPPVLTPTGTCRAAPSSVRCPARRENEYQRRESTALRQATGAAAETDRTERVLGWRKGC